MREEVKLIRQMQRRQSRDAADKLVRLYYDEIYVFACRQLACKEDALDLTQEIFIAALQSLPRFDSKKASFRTWLYRIASHKVIDLRRKQRHVLSLEELEPPDPTDFTQRIRDSLLLEEIETYVTGFSDEVQAVYRLHLYGEKTFAEIAEITRQPEATVKARYYRLLAQIRKEFPL